MKDLIQKTIARLKSEKIKPLPKWRFVLIDILYWVLVILGGIFSVVAVASGIYLFFQIDWEATKHFPGGITKALFLYVPYLWLFVLIVLSGAVFYFIRKTNKGYKYKSAVVLLSFLSLVVAVGAGANFIEIGKMTDDFAFRHLPHYRDFAPGMEHMWQKPQEGFLAGKIDSVEVNSIKITDLNEKKWEIVLTNETVLKSPEKLKTNEVVKIIGKIERENVFKAEIVNVGLEKPMRGFEYHKNEDNFSNKPPMEKFKHNPPQLPFENR